jgi:hypothetical protein
MAVGRRKNESSRPPFIVSMSPTDYPSAWLRPRSARFRFARQDHCSSVPFVVFIKLGHIFAGKVRSSFNVDHVFWIWLQGRVDGALFPYAPNLRSTEGVLRSVLNADFVSS